MRSGLGLVMAVGVLALVACGEDADRASDGRPSVSTAGAKVIDPSAAESATGTVTYCTGKDTSGAQRASVRAFNRRFEEDGLRARLLEFPESADQQRSQFIQRQRAGSSECDVFYSDVIWTAEFASQKWLYDLTPLIEDRKDEFMASKPARAEVRSAISPVESAFSALGRFSLTRAAFPRLSTRMFS